MIKENQKLFNRLNVATDAAAAFISIAAAYLLVFSLLDFDRNYPLVDYFKLLLIFVPLQLVTYGCMGLYSSFRGKSFANETGKLTAALFLDGMAMIALLYVIQIINFSRWALAIFLALDFLIVLLKRFILRKTLRKFRESGYNRKYVLIVGSGHAARDYLKTINEERWLGYQCCGCVSDSPLEGAKLLGGYDRLLDILEEKSYDEVVCALDSDGVSQLSNIVEACELTGTKISVIPSIYKYMSATPAIDMVGDIPLMNIRRIPLDNMGNAALKRALDIVGSLVLLILTSPVILVSMLIIKITMGGNVIFRQKRVGLNKKVFTMYKLKSMRDSAVSDTAWSTDADPRRTKFGAFIRKFSIDELPQLVNVLKGNMSLVGPRPEIPFYVNDFKDKIPMYMIKHQVKPGITGLAQVNGYRGDTSIEKRIEYDIRYIENWSFFLDIGILIRTALSGFMNKEKLNPDKPGSKKYIKPYRPEKTNMKKTEGKTDLLALVMFLPSVIALALIPIIINIQTVVTDLQQTYMYNGGTVVSGDSGTTYQLIDFYSQGKALAAVVLAMIMIGMALVCCLSLFRRVEKRSFVYVGCSVVYVVMTLASAANSLYSQIAFNGEYDRAEGFYTIACYFVMFLFTMYAFRTSGNFKFVATALFICVGFNAVLSAFQFFNNNLLQYDWFVNLVCSNDLRWTGVSVDIRNGMAYGALYNSNYMGSFTGLIIPLFTVMAMYSKKAVYRVLFIVFDLLSVFMLLGSSARSGIVAIAAALVVGIIVFARVIAKHWKPCVIAAASIAVVLVGANFALGNRLFSRIPSIVNDAVGMFLPADSEDADLFDKIPLREIDVQNDGTVKLTGQEATAVIGYDSDAKVYTFTDENGNALPMKSTIRLEQNPELDGLVAGFDYANMIATVKVNGAQAWFNVDDSGSLVLNSDIDYVLDDPDGNGSIGTDSTYGTVTVDLNGSTVYIEYDTDYNRLFFTEYTDDIVDLFYTERMYFKNDIMNDVSLLLTADENGSIYDRDLVCLNFYRDFTNSLYFKYTGTAIKMVHPNTMTAFAPVNAEHIGFEGKEELGSSRGYIWSRTLPLLGNCLFTGYGPDTFTYNFPQNDVLAKYYSYEQFDQGFYVTVDKPHNLYLQIFYSSGLIALLAFLGIVVFYLVDCFRLYALRREYRTEQAMGISVMLGIVGYLAAGMFNDSVVSVAPVFWILLGVGAALNTINRRADRRVAVDEDYIPEAPVVEKPVDPELKKQAADAAQILAAAVRTDVENEKAEKEKRRQERMAHTPSKEDISSLLESVRAIKTVEDKQREEAEKQAGSTQANPAKENSDDNG